MSRRMMCTQCFETAEPETVLEGSDLAEILSWLCFAVPGWLYCLWRHALRSRVCAACGGASLIREARAAQKRVAEASAPPRVRSASGSVRWPPALARPRERLLHGGIAAAFTASTIVAAWSSDPTILVASAGLATGWLVFQIGRIVRTRGPSCSAWDASGRELQIEVA
jgi:hypothetical protein